MYLIDTNVISEARKASANPGVITFFRQATARNQAGYLSVITIGELRRGAELIRRRGDAAQAEHLERWLQGVLSAYRAHVLDFDMEAAQVWGVLRVRHHESAFDKQIAATALVHDLTLVTRNVSDFRDIGVRLLDPFVPA